MDSTASASLPTHLNIVALETHFSPLPKLVLPSPYTFTLTEYDRTKPEEIPERIKDAHVVITTAIRLHGDTLSPETCPNLKLISLVAAGIDSIDLATCASRGIRVMNSPDCNADVVAEHAVAFYFALRRSLVPVMREIEAGEWSRRGSLMHTAFAAGKPPRSLIDETAAIIGYGAVGKKVAKLLEALGMKVIVAGRKGTSQPSDGRVAFEEVLKVATVVVLCCPRVPETLGLLSAPEFALMRNDAVLVNVSRGTIVDEEALVVALKDGQIAGAATDVFHVEPANSETSPLLRSETTSLNLNLVMTSHTAWVGERTTGNYQRTLQKNIEDFILGVHSERVKV